MADSITDESLGVLNWNEQLEWWEGKIQLDSETPFTLYIFARSDLTPNRTITDECRAAIERIANREAEYRKYAATELVDIHNSEWNDGPPTSNADFANRLAPDSVEVHESGYAEIHFGDGGLFWDHGVGVRLRESGEFQEAVVEG